jgi:hypothetical protein
LQGRPVVKENYLKLENISAQVTTNNLLGKAAAFLFKDQLVQKLETAVRYSLDPSFEKIRRKMDGTLNSIWSKDIRGEGRITKLKLEGIDCQYEGLVIRIACAGELGIAVSENLFAF